MPMTPPDFDSKPLYTDGAGFGWVGYGIFFEWPSACFQIFDWNDEETANPSSKPTTPE